MYDTARLRNSRGRLVFLQRERWGERDRLVQHRGGRAGPSGRGQKNERQRESCQLRLSSRARASAEVTETLVVNTRETDREGEGQGEGERERSGTDYPAELKQLLNPALNMETFRFPEVPSQTSGQKEDVMSKKHLNVLVRQLAHSPSASLWPRAEKVVSWLESIDYPVDSWMYCEVLRSFRNRGEVTRALQLYRKVVAIRPKLRLTSHFYAEAMLALSKGTPEEARLALPIWNDLLRNGAKGVVKPTTTTTTTTTTKFKEKGKGERRGSKDGREKERERDTSALSKYALTAFLCACATSGEWKRAMRAFHSDFFLFQIANATEMEKARQSLQLPDVVACTALMKCLRVGGQWQKGEELLQWMFENGIDPNAYTYVSLITLLGETNQWEKVVDYFDELMRNSGRNVSSSSLGQMGPHNQAKVRVQHVMLPNIRPNIHIFSATVNALTTCGQYDLAMSVLNQMIEGGIRPNAIFLVSLLSIYEKRREGRLALQLFRYIQNKTKSTLLHNNQCKKAKHGSGSNLNLNLKNDQKHMNILVYNVLLSALSKSEAVDGVQEVFEEICSLEKESESKAKAKGEGEGEGEIHSNLNSNHIKADRVTYETMISAYAHVADFKQADQMFAEMCRKGFQPSDYAYAARIKAYAKNNLWRESVAILREVEEQGTVPPSVHVYNATLYACEITQKWELALKLYARMEEKGIEPNRVTKALIAKICNSGIEIYEEKQRQTAALAAIGAAAGALAIRTGVF